MRVINPSKAPLVTAADKSALQAAMTALADRNPTFDEIRAALPSQAMRDRFTDGVLHQIASDLGLTVQL